MSVHALASAPPESSLFDDASLVELSDNQLKERLLGYSSQIAALTSRFFDILVEFDSRSAWSGYGVQTCAHWLSWQAGVSIRTAQDHVRTAHALSGLPRLREAFARGRLSYSKVRALTRVATAAREEELLNFALSATASQVERLVRTLRETDRADEESSIGIIESTSRWRWNPDSSLTVTMRLSPLDGASFLAGVVRAEYERTRTIDDGDVPAIDGAHNGDNPVGPDLWRNVPSDIASAVVAMAETACDAISVPEFVPGAEVVLHTSAAEDHDPAYVDGGPVMTLVIIF